MPRTQNSPNRSRRNMGIARDEQDRSANMGRQTDQWSTEGRQSSRNEDQENAGYEPSRSPNKDVEPNNVSRLRRNERNSNRAEQGNDPYTPRRSEDEYRDDKETPRFYSSGNEGEETEETEETEEKEDGRQIRSRHSGS